MIIGILLLLCYTDHQSTLSPKNYISIAAWIVLIVIVIIIIYMLSVDVLYFSIHVRKIIMHTAPNKIINNKNKININI